MPHSSNRKKRRPLVECPHCNGKGAFTGIVVAAPFDKPQTCALCGGEKIISQELDAAYKLLLGTIPSELAILHLYETAPNLLSAQARILLWERLNAEINQRG